MRFVLSVQGPPVFAILPRTVMPTSLDGPKDIGLALEIVFNVVFIFSLIRHVRVLKKARTSHPLQSQAALLLVVVAFGSSLAFIALREELLGIHDTAWATAGIRALSYVPAVVVSGLTIFTLSRGQKSYLPHFLRLAAMQINTLALVASQADHGDPNKPPSILVIVSYTLIIIILLHLEAVSLYVYYDTWFRYYTSPKGMNFAYRLFCLTLDTGVPCSFLVMAYLLSLLASSSWRIALPGCVMQTACLSISSLSVFLVRLPHETAPAISLDGVHTSTLSARDEYEYRSEKMQSV